MVRAILDNRKTQTRRPIKPQPTNLPEGAYCDPYNKNHEHFTFWTKDNKMILGSGGNIKNTAHWRCPYGKPGDRLWVRESFWCVDMPGMDDTPCLVYEDEFIEYQKDEEWNKPILPCGIKFGHHPSIHMPRWASRITLEITDVRVERVQDGIVGNINTCNKEGCFDYDYKHTKWFDKNGWERNHKGVVGQFIDIWNSLYAKKGYGWDVNPWVWVLEFKRYYEKITHKKTRPTLVRKSP